MASKRASRKTVAGGASTGLLPLTRSNGNRVFFINFRLERRLCEMRRTFRRRTLAGCVGAARTGAYRDARRASGRAMLDVPYGERARNRFDLFGPKAGQRAWSSSSMADSGRPRQELLSHLARGSVEGGYAWRCPPHAVPDCAHLPRITREISAAVARAAAMVEGPLFFWPAIPPAASGDTHDFPRRSRRSRRCPGAHSATPSPFPACMTSPLMKAAMNTERRIDEAEARAESPAARAMQNARVTAGGQRRAPEFVPRTRSSPHRTGLGARNPHDRRTGRQSFRRHRRARRSRPPTHPDVVVSVDC